MTKFRKRLAFYLTNTLAGNTEFTTDFLQGAGMSIFQSETKGDDLALTLRKTIEDLPKLLLEHGEAGRIGRNDRSVVFDEVTELAILFFTDGSFKGYGLLADLLDFHARAQQ